MSTVDTRRAPRDRAERTPNALLAVLFVAVVGFAVQQTAIVPAVQTVERSLHSTSEWAAWLVTIYLVVATVATPALGRLADLFGRRRMLLIGLAVFVVGSVAAALAPSMPFLIVCRAVQGVGGAVYPLCLAMAREALPRERVSAAVALLTAGFGTGTAIGFLAGGLLAQYASWRYIFVTGAVLVAAGFVLVRSQIPGGSGVEDVDDRQASGTFDRWGTVVLAVTVTSLLVALTLVVPLGWVSPAPLILFAVTLAAGVAWVRLETRRPDPLVDVHVLREPTVAVANLATIGLGWALFGSYLLLPQFIEARPATAGFGLGGDAATAGILLLPLAAGQLAAGWSGSVLSARIGSRPVFALGLTFVVLALVALAFDRGSTAGLALSALLLGVGAGLALETSSSVATEGVPPEVAGVSSAVNSTVRRLAGGIGGQLSTIVLASFVVGSSDSPSHTGFVISFVVAAVIAGAGLVLLLSGIGRETT